MKQPKSTIILNNRPYSVADFLNLENQPAWLADVQHVIHFWLSDEKALNVKTSGSTAKPKLIQLPRTLLAQSARATLQRLDVEPNATALLFIPAKYIGGKMLLIRALVGDMDIHLYEPAAQLPDMQHSFDLVSLTPMQAARSLHQLERFKTILLGGGPISDELHEKLQGLSVRIYHTYGMTETASHVALKKLNGPDQKPYFKALPGIRFSLDERDCLVIHAPAWGISQLVTNDVVTLHSETCFTWLGRADNVVNSGGIKLYPEEIERLLAPAINKPFFVAGLPDAELGQRLVLVVESETEFAIDYSQLDGYQKPREAFFTAHFVYTETGKVNRKATIELL
jgi:O-succinylbenzoic acid--CoA ligase